MIPLNNIPVVGTALSFVTSKARLVVEYIMVGVIVATAAVTFTLWLQKNAMEKDLTVTKQSLTLTEARLNQVELVNNEQQTTITTMRNEHIKDGIATAKLLKQIEDISKENTDVRNSINELEKANADVAKYMSDSIPDELRRLLGDD